MSNHRKMPREKSGARASNGKSPGEKKLKSPPKKEPKQKTIAAEIENVGRREAAPPATSQPRQAAPALKPSEPVKPAAAQAKPAVPPRPVASKPLQAPPKPAPVPDKPAAAAAKPASAAKPAPKSATAPTPSASPDFLGSAVDTLQRTFEAAGQGTRAVNCKLLDFARANVNSSLDYVKDLAAARSPARVMRLQMEYWHDCLETFASQAQELRTLSAELVADANAPLREHMRGTRRQLR